MRAKAGWCPGNWAGQAHWANPGRTICSAVAPDVVFTGAHPAQFEGTCGSTADRLTGVLGGGGRQSRSKGLGVMSAAMRSSWPPLVRPQASRAKGAGRWCGVPGTGEKVVLRENGLVGPVVLVLGATAWGQGNGLGSGQRPAGRCHRMVLTCRFTWQRRWTRAPAGHKIRKAERLRRSQTRRSGAGIWLLCSNLRFYLRPQPDSNLRTRLRRPRIQASEFVPWPRCFEALTGQGAFARYPRIGWASLSNTNGVAVVCRTTTPLAVGVSP